ncbi:unnamed protein product [Acanthoscelides obtectus]|uniref:Ionotropic receptor 75a N-terminal domain-containing protein n=1 Tax=Acanthoscelides obtectus TaxID=200917 RepID=A0A9P0KPN5_ACAOB|nr:unnamed protein product [Acanthoscelides obtectus]CAK1657769.1 hypothetical protein AOBTE_LOCUS20525 [Acanthoscelides obtectus]
MLQSLQISDQHLFESPAKYLILVDAGSHDKLLKMMERLEILPMSEIVIATFLSDSLAHLYKPYKISKDTSLILEACGKWSKNDGMRNLCNELKIERRHNFGKYNIKISVVVKKNESINIKNFDDLLYVSIFTHIFICVLCLDRLNYCNNINDKHMWTVNQRG